MQTSTVILCRFWRPALDNENSERIFKLLTELVKREEKALLLATHNPLIARASDFIHEMKDGVIARRGGASG